MTAALISTHAGYIFLTFLPPILWLLFYLHEDRRPEPKMLLVLTFVGGMASAIVAIFAEYFFLDDKGIFPWLFGVTMGANPFFFFFVIAIVEEYVKYLPFKFLISGRNEFDEPVDAMIYMMTAAMGFAALENALFAIPLFRESFFSGIEIVANRFLGANLLHALSSAIVGFFIAKSFLSPRRHHFIAAGIVVASVLHMAFNYLILESRTLPLGVMYLFFLLLLMTIMVLIEFEQLKKRNVNLERE